MAKHNDMPELNSAKVFSTNLFTKEHLKHPYQQALTADKGIQPRPHTYQTFLPGALQALQKNRLQAQYRYSFEKIRWLLKATYTAAPNHYSATAILPGNSDMNGFTVYGFNRYTFWLNDELTGFAKNEHKLPA